jgi:hypothetical protein
MPRTAKKMQTPAAPQDQGYGVRGEQIAAQATMGIPDNQASPEVAAIPVDPTTGVPVSGGTAAPTDPAALLESLRAQAPPPAGGLARPTDRPEEPVTAGLNAPAVTQMLPPNKAAETLEAIFATTGDQRFAALAARARLL